MFRSGSALVALLKSKLWELFVSCGVCTHALAKRRLCLAIGKESFNDQSDTFWELTPVKASEFSGRKTYWWIRTEELNRLRKGTRTDSTVSSRTRSNLIMNSEDSEYYCVVLKELKKQSWDIPSRFVFKCHHWTVSEQLALSPRLDLHLSSTDQPTLYVFLMGWLSSSW
jgi:hypothetical protein